MMIVAKFGVRKFLAGQELAEQEMRAAARYYQGLVAIERWRRQEYAAIRSATVPGLSEIDAAYEQLDEYIGEHAGRGGKRGVIREKRRKATAATGVPTKRVDIEEEVDAITIAKEWRKEAGKIAKPLRAEFAGIVEVALAEHIARAAALRKEWNVNPKDKHAKVRSEAMARAAMLSEEGQWPSAWRRLAALDETVTELRSWVKEARLLSTGTYYAVQRRDFPAACKRPRPRPDGEPRRPKQRPMYSPHRLRRIGWEIKDCTWGELLAGRCHDLQLTDVRTVGGGNGGRVKQRATVTMRLRAEDRLSPSGKPDYYRPEHKGEWGVKIDIVVHRPIPADTKVKWVYLVPEERSRGKWEYTVQFTLEPTVPLIQRAPGPQGTVALVNLCWTQHGETLIVAKINGEPLMLPLGKNGKRGSVVPALRHAERLRSAADKKFDVACEELKLRVQSLPDAVQRAAQGLGQWRAHWRLHRVSEALLASLDLREEERAMWQKWMALRRETGQDFFEPDVAAYAAILGLSTPATVFAFWLATWRRKDRHMEEMASAARRHGMGCRRDFYRVTAARLSERFERCEIGGAVDLESMALRDKSEDKPHELHQAARHNRQLACVHELKGALKAAFGPDRYHEKDQGKKAAASDEEGSAVTENSEANDDTVVSESVEAAE